MLEEEVLGRLIAEGSSTSQIAKKLDCSKDQVLYWVHKFGLQMPRRTRPGAPKRVTPEQAANAVRYVAAHRKRIKARSIAYKGGKCQLCGYSRCNNALEFHHLDRNTKDFGLSHRGWTRSLDTIKRELEKCVLVCANCHREIEAGVRNIANVNP